MVYLFQFQTIAPICLVGGTTYMVLGGIVTDRMLHLVDEDAFSWCCTMCRLDFLKTRPCLLDITVYNLPSSFKFCFWLLATKFPMLHLLLRGGAQLVRAVKCSTLTSTSFIVCFSMCVNKSDNFHKKSGEARFTFAQWLKRSN